MAPQRSQRGGCAPRRRDRGVREEGLRPSDAVEEESERRVRAPSIGYGNVDSQIWHLQRLTASDRLGRPVKLVWSV